MRKRLHREQYRVAYFSVSVPLRGLDMRKQQYDIKKEESRNVSVPLRGLDMRKLL